MKVLVIYDGTLDSQAALQYGIRRVREHGGDLVVLAVFPAHLFIDYDAGPKAEEVVRRELFVHVDDALELIRAQGDVHAQIIMVDGRAEDEVLRCAGNEKVDLIVSPPSFESVTEKAFCLTDIVGVDEYNDNEHRGLDELAGAGPWRLH